MRTATRTLMLLALALAAACAGGRGAPADDPGAEPTLVRVENQSWLDMNIFVVEGGQRIRLGSVTGNSSGTLRIPRSVIGLGRNLSFIADPVGSRSQASSFEIYVRPGETVSLTIPPQVR